MRRSLAALLVLAAVAVPAAYAKPHPLRAYIDRVAPPIASYRALLLNVDTLLSEPPVTNVDPLVEKLRAIADRFDRLDARWLGISAPRGLVVRHRGMGRGFEIQAEAWRMYAAALFTRQLDEIQAATATLAAMLRSAAYLQHRWEAALRGALVRAGMRVPQWLEDLAARVP
jgi:hypothetical protein